MKVFLYPNCSINWDETYMFGAAHCSINSSQRKDPYPRENFQIIIDCVDKIVQLNTTVSSS
jgi:hypothetical protein